MKQEKITRVIFEYEDHAEALTGKEAEEWLDAVNGMCVLAQNRGQNPFDAREFKWEAHSEAADEAIFNRVMKIHNKTKGKGFIEGAQWYRELMRNKT